jgi:uncharacterized SAM-binding protein YcdF (DUF218 family)
MPKYDLIVIPGLRHGPRWGMRRDLKTQLAEAARLYHQGEAAKVAVCGRWNIWFDWRKVVPPVTEAKLMKRYLVRRNVPASAILMEQHSKDTIGNAYYLKRLLDNHPGHTKILIICAAQRITRARLIFETFLGPDYDIAFRGICAPNFDQDATGMEEHLLKEQTGLLSHIRPGHTEDFGHRIYNLKYYRDQAKLV